MAQGVNDLGSCLCLCLCRCRCFCLCSSNINHNNKQFRLMSSWGATLYLSLSHSLFRFVSLKNISINNKFVIRDSQFTFAFGFAFMQNMFAYRTWNHFKYLHCVMTTPHTAPLLKPLQVSFPPPPLPINATDFNCSSLKAFTRFDLIWFHSFTQWNELEEI